MAEKEDKIELMQVPGTAEHNELTASIIEELIKNKQGTPKNDLVNIVSILKKDSMFSGMFKLNLFTMNLEVVHSWYTRYQPCLCDEDITQIILYINTVYGISSNIENTVRNAVGLIAVPYHPIKEKISSIEWDKKKRLPLVLNKFLGADINEYTEAVTRIMFLGAISRVFNPGCKFDTMIILFDKKQGCGKSSFARLMALDDKWFTDSLIDINDTNKAFYSTQGAMIVEMGELLGFYNAKNVETLKSYLSRQTDKLCLKYEKYVKEFPRHCIFIGTTNKENFLPDDKSGNRRFVPIICHADRIEKHILENEEESRAYIEQCYAEAYQLFLEAEGRPDLLLPQSLNSTLEQIQLSCEQEDEDVGRINEWLENHPEIDKVCVAQIWREALGGIDKPSRTVSNNIVGILDNKCHLLVRSGQLRFQIYGKQQGWIRKNTAEWTTVSELIPF